MSDLSKAIRDLIEALEVGITTSADDIHTLALKRLLRKFNIKAADSNLSMLSLSTITGLGSGGAG